MIPNAQKLIEIRPIEVKKWHEKTKDESFTRPKKIQALVDSNTMKYSTGLTSEEIQELTSGERAVNYNLSDHFDMRVPHPFWDGPMGVIKLENNTMFFDISQPLKYIHYKVMKASKYVANSPSEYEDGLWPEATHVIWDESEQVEMKASKIELKNQAIVELSKIDDQRKKELILVLRGKNVMGNSAAFLVPILDEIVTNSAKELLEVLTMDKKELKTRAIVIASLDRGILRKDGHKIFYMDSPLGEDESAVVKYLMEDANQDFKMTIIDKLNN